jgi:arginine:ornithine antiporter/lysine permease
MCAILFAPGIIVFAIAKRERGKPAFEGLEWVLAAAVALIALIAAYLLWTGRISPF